MFLVVLPLKDNKYNDNGVINMPAELDNQDPTMDPQATADMEAPEAMPAPEGEVIGVQDGGIDQEGAMAKADLLKLATYSKKLGDQLHDDDQLEAWVQAKITKAADYIASVYHYLEYEMKFSEYGQHLDNADTLSEGQKMRMKELLAEAKDKVKEIKKAQAEKVKKVDENRLAPHDEMCDECGGTGYKSVPGMTVHPAHAEKVSKYAKLRKAVKAIHNQHMDGEEPEMTAENFDGERGGDQDTPSKFNVQKTSTGTRYTRKSSTFSDEHDGGDGKKSHAKSKSADEKKKEAPHQKKSKTGTWGMEGGEKFDNRKKTDESKGKCCCEEKSKAKCPVHGKMEEAQETMSRAAKGVMKYGKDGMKALAKAGKEGKDLDKVRDKFDKYDESAPSAGLSKEKKSAVVKKAKAGGDIGKPGKSFDKVAKAAGGGEKGEKIAAAAMWKNIKETTAYLEEKKEKMAKKDYDGDGKIETGSEEHAGSVDKAIKAAKAKETVKESADYSQFKSNLKRLLG